MAGLNPRCKKITHIAFKINSKNKFNDLNHKVVDDVDSDLKISI